MIYNFYDFDDTLVLTRPAIFLSYSYALKRVMGITLPWGEFNNKLYANANAYMAQLGFSEKNMREVKRIKNEIYLQKYWQDVEILKDDFKTGEMHYVVSNTSSYVIDEILRKLNMREHFEVIIGSDIYFGANRKPAPDLYNYAFSQIKKDFNRDVDTVIIHEDSIFGLNAALSFYEENKQLIKRFKINYTPQSFN